MDFRILGPLDALDGGEPVALEGSKRRALLALLLLHANETLSSDRLIDELWGEQPPATAAKTLQVHVSRLRKALTGGPGGGADVVVTREHGYELRVDLEQIDSHRFERLLNEGRRSSPPTAPTRPWRRSSRRLRCGAALRSRTSPTSHSRRLRSRGSRTSGRRRWSS